MAIKLHNINVAKATAELVWNGDTVHIVYDPNAYTSALEGEWRTVDEEGYVGIILTRFVLDMVSEWDVLGDWDAKRKKLVESDAPFPLVEEKLIHLPSIFMAAVVNAVQEDVRPGKAKSETSDDG